MFGRRGRLRRSLLHGCGEKRRDEEESDHGRPQCSTTCQVNFQVAVAAAPQVTVNVPEPTAYLYVTQVASLSIGVITMLEFAVTFELVIVAAVADAAMALLPVDVLQDAQLPGVPELSV